MDPVTREEMYLAYMAGDTSVPLPEPVTRLERFWYNVAMNGSGGGTSANNELWYPTVDPSTGNISWEKSASTNAPATANIKGPTGANGKDGADGQDGSDGITPTIGDNENWWLGDVDTEKPSRGPAGVDAPQYEYYSNENILINADFREPVDTKRGHIVPPDTPYYSDTGLSAQAGTVSVWTEVKKESDAYGAVTVGGSTYYVEWSAAVAGYNRNGVTIDGWSAVCYSAEGSPVLMTGSGLKLVGNHQIDQFGQGFSGREAVLFSGKTVTISILCRGTKTTKRIAIYGNNYGNYILRQFVPSSEEVFELFSATAVFPESVPVGGDPTFRIHQSYVAAPENDWLEVRAVKVELGDHQTLAHQDESGRWVLNEAPNKAKQLALCSQYDPDTGAFQDSLLVTLADILGGPIIHSTTEGSAKKFRLLVDDNGSITAVEV